jgi:hypothetical protein
MKTCDYNLDSFTAIGFLLTVLFVATLGGLFSRNSTQRKEALIGGFKYVGFFFGFLLLLEIIRGRTFC